MSLGSHGVPPELAGDSTGRSIQSDPALLAEGWTRRHLVDPARAQESIELYTSMGFEVKAHKLTPADFGPKCQGCASVVCQGYVLIYTRKKDGEGSTID